MLQIYNSLNRQIEPLTVPKKVNIYSCGPTVYDFAHIGNFRSFLMSDILCRVLRLNGKEVHRVMNITDVGHLTNDDAADADGEDKVAKKALKEGKTAQEIADWFADKFIEDEQQLKILAPGILNNKFDHKEVAKYRPKATEYIQEQIDMTQDLINRGFAYEVNGSVYFRTQKFDEYGKLSGNKLEDLQAGARVEINSEKEDPLDFALWKKADANHLMQWESPWGMGFPGWHIECSAMGQALFDEIHIHTGGEDNAFPHHECEIAQNECCSKNLIIKYWIHGKHLLVDGAKMSKSKGNFYTIRDLTAKGWTGAEIRYALISGHYRTALNFTEDSLVQAQGSIKRIQELPYKLNEINPVESGDTDWIDVVQQKYLAALNDDLNVAEALAVVFEMVSESMKRINDQKICSNQKKALETFLYQDFNGVFGVLDVLENQVPAEIETLLAERDQARANKNWSDSDRLRDEIQNLGYEVLDSKEGTKVRKVA